MIASSRHRAQGPPRQPTEERFQYLPAPGHMARGLLFCGSRGTGAVMTEPKLATVAVHAGSPHGANAPVTVPIVQSTTFRFESAAAVQRYGRGESGLYMYSRDENPTVRAAEEAVARLEGGDSCVLFASGMGAITAAVMALVSGG